MEEIEDKEYYYDFAIAPYALKDVIVALQNSGLFHIGVTKADEELHVRFSRNDYYKSL